jgi:hypothetical protein
MSLQLWNILWHAKKNKIVAHRVFVCSLKFEEKLKVSTNLENVEGKRSFPGNKMLH